MIRINLLSGDKKLKRRDVGSKGSWGAVFAVLLLLEILGLYYWGDAKAQMLVVKTQASQRIDKELDELKLAERKHRELQDKLEEEQIQTEIFSRLKNGREGASNLLLYLTYILTRPSMENREERVVQEQLGWSSGWDTDRAWFTHVRSTALGGISISGEALTHRDTDEVLKRLRSTVFLQDLVLVHSTKKKTREDSPDLISFKFDARVNYDPFIGKESEENDE